METLRLSFHRQGYSVVFPLFDFLIISKDLDEIPLDERYIAEIHIAKHRNGPTGIIKLTFNEEHVNFESPKKNQYATTTASVPETQTQPQPEPQF